ncbi:3-deoxy-7-phosphoheptulonate synthase [Calycomorphotria hydatis]|uniref:Phospho-2-dehydro-3-deoxyheptonate aldolase n=1 Tax=Calycomorphotria hydatis TaxID=2528027 RepID=A0A517TEZ8_9PLAN|nr:3-deoxy-7-phosphoheptulonate synthase [Calycomorphotria hydatis]QDT66945.1 Phospho-2-dehydro-3-deoxyheptonate aldolase [Calycomorphotria hydatis]
MIVVLKPGTDDATVKKLTDRVEGFGMTAHVIIGTERTVIAAVGDEKAADQEELEAYAEVERVMTILAPYKIASRETKPEPSLVEIKGLKFGAGHVGVVAGPCSIESEQQIFESARYVRETGAKGLRGGAFKPRTSPYSFQGMKEEGLKLLQAAGEETGLATVTEIMAPHDVDLLCRYADVLQIGARNMQNYTLLEAVGETNTPVLLKRGPAASIDEFLLAAEYILNKGNQQVVLCERGIRTFESHTRFTLPLATVPYLHERTHLPIVIDPSHGTGIASLVPSMCYAAVAAECDGLLIETHPDPTKAVSDGPQSLTPEDFAKTMKRCKVVADAVGLKWSE